MTRTRQARLIEGPIAPTLAKLTLTMLIGIFSMIAFNLVDTFFVGRLGADALAAISFTFPIVMAVGSIALGLGVGAAALISRAIGAEDDEQVRRLTTDSLALALVIVGVVCHLWSAHHRPRVPPAGRQSDHATPRAPVHADLVSGHDLCRRAHGGQQRHPRHGRYQDAQLDHAVRSGGQCRAGPDPDLWAGPGAGARHPWARPSPPSLRAPPHW